MIGFSSLEFSFQFQVVLTFIVDCLLNGDSWAECKAQLLDEYFPYFVRRKVIRDMIVYNFQSEGQPLRVYIDQVYRAANFLEYNASKQHLVDRIVLNFYPSILAHATFLDKPLLSKWSE
jgi:hypothetical protein